MDSDKEADEEARQAAAEFSELSVSVPKICKISAAMHGEESKQDKILDEPTDQTNFKQITEQLKSSSSLLQNKENEIVAEQVNETLESLHESIIYILKNSENVSIDSTTIEDAKENNQNSEVVMADDPVKCVKDIQLLETSNDFIEVGDIRSKVDDNTSDMVILNTTTLNAKIDIPLNIEISSPVSSIPPEMQADETPIDKPNHTYDNIYTDNGCLQCANLNQEIQKLRKQSQSNLNIFKQKLISTSDLITEYHKKCQELKEQKMKMNELNKKLENCYGETGSLRIQLQKTIQATEPLKKTVRRFEYEKMLKQSELDDLSQKLKDKTAEVTELKELISSYKTTEESHRNSKNESGKLHEKEKKKVLNQAKQIDRLHLQLKTAKERNKVNVKQLKAANKEKEKLLKRIEKSEKVPKLHSQRKTSAGKASRSSPDGVLSPSPSPPISPSPQPPSPPQPSRVVARKKVKPRSYLTRRAVRAGKKSSSSSSNSSSQNSDQNISSSNDDSDGSDEDDDINNLHEMLMEKLDKQIAPTLKQWNAATILSPPLSPMPPSPIVRNNNNSSEEDKTSLKKLENIYQKDVPKLIDKGMDVQETNNIDDSSYVALLHNESMTINDTYADHIDTDGENAQKADDKQEFSLPDHQVHNVTPKNAVSVLNIDSNAHNHKNVINDVALNVSEPSSSFTDKLQSETSKRTLENHSSSSTSDSDDNIILKKLQLKVLKKKDLKKYKNDKNEKKKIVGSDPSKKANAQLERIDNETSCLQKASKSVIPNHHYTSVESNSTNNKETDMLKLNLTSHKTEINDTNVNISLRQNSKTCTKSCTDSEKAKANFSNSIDEINDQKGQQSSAHIETSIKVISKEQTPDTSDRCNENKDSLHHAVDYEDSKESNAISVEETTGIETFLNVIEKSNDEKVSLEKQNLSANVENENKTIKEEEDVSNHISSFNRMYKNTETIPQIDQSKISNKVIPQSKELDDVDFEVASFELSQNSLNKVPDKVDVVQQSLSTSARALDIGNSSYPDIKSFHLHKSSDQTLVSENNRNSKYNTVKFSLPEKGSGPNISGHTSKKSGMRILRRHSMFENSPTNPQLRTDRTRSLSPSMFKPPSPPLSPIPPSPRRSILTPIISPLPTTLPESVSPLPPSPKITSPPLIRGTAVLHSENSSLCIPKPVIHKKLSAVKELTFTKSNSGINSKDKLPGECSNISTEDNKLKGVQSDEINRMVGKIHLRSSSLNCSEQKEQQNIQYDLIENNQNLQSIKILPRKRGSSSTISVPPKLKKMDPSSSSVKPGVSKSSCGIQPSGNSNEPTNDNKMVMTTKRCAPCVPISSSDDDTLQIVSESCHSQDESNMGQQPSHDAFKKPIKRIKHGNPGNPELIHNADNTNSLHCIDISTIHNVSSRKQQDDVNQEKGIKLRDRNQTEVGFTMKILQKLPNSISITNAIQALSERKNLSNPDSLIKALMKCFRTCEKNLLHHILKNLENDISNACLCESESDLLKHPQTSIYCPRCWNKSLAVQNHLTHELGPSLNAFHLLHPRASKLNTPCMTVYEYCLLLVAQKINFKTFPSLILKQLHKTIYAEKELLSCERMALFRFYAAVCRLYNKLDQLISFVYCVAYDEPEHVSFPILFVTCYSIWPSIVSRTDLFMQSSDSDDLVLFKIKMSPLTAVLQLVALCDSVNKKESTSQKILETLLSIKCVPSKHYAAVVNELFSLLCNKQLSYMERNEDGHVMCPFAFSVVKGIELLSTRLGWEWCYVNMIEERVWKELQRWSANKIPDDTAAILIRLNGRLCRYAFACGYRDFCELTNFYSNFLQKICLDSTVHESIHTAIVCTLLDLIPCDVISYRTVLRNWLNYADHRQFIISRPLRNAISVNNSVYL